MENNINIILDFIKDNFPNKYNKLDFIDDDWIEHNKNVNPITFMSVIKSIKDYNICSECKNNSGSAVASESCMQTIPTLNVTSSNFYKKIIFTEEPCPTYESYKKSIKVEHLTQDSGLCDSMLGKTLDSFVASNESLKLALTTCQDYVDNFDIFKEKGIGLYMWSSNPGNGKSHLSIGVGLAVLDQYGVPVKYCNMVELNNKYKSMLNKNFAAFSVVPEIYEHEGLLILDDIGTEVGTQRVGEIAYSIIHYRYDHSLPTVYTSNYSLEDLAERYISDDGLKIADRIRGRCPVIRIIAPSYRAIELDLLLQQ